MSLSFEELADAGLPPIEPSNTYSYKWILIPVCLVLAAIAGWFLKMRAEPELPAAAQLLVVTDPEVASEGTLPHVVDEVTEFPTALDYLKEGAAQPELRVPPEEIIEEIVVEAAPVQEVVDVEAFEVTIDLGAEAEAPMEAVVIEESLPVEMVQTVPTLAELDLTMVRDWGGIVLVPDDVRLSRAFSSSVRLSRIEAHPIDGDRLRVWMRVQNLTQKDLKIRVGCNFRASDDSSAGADVRKIVIPQAGAAQVQFVSRDPWVKAYTLLVKRLN